LQKRVSKELGKKHMKELVEKAVKAFLAVSGKSDAIR